MTSMDYRAPVDEQLFALESAAALVGTDPNMFDRDLVSAVLQECGRLADEIFAPLNRVGDTVGALWSAGSVTHPAGFSAAYEAYVAGGWQGLSASPDFGGAGLPLALSVAANEQFSSANMAFALCPILTAGAIEALSAHGDEALNRTYLPRLVSGRWTGTMNLTEPQAGSDVGALRTMAIPAEDGTWRIRGSKIFISWGEHSLAENIVHLVLARTPDSPAGTRGISLFLVPKFIPDGDGHPRVRNDLRCVSIEHKIGLHASPTCTMSFGDDGGCIGWLVGPLHGGMRAMFSMMNHARLAIGVEGVAIAERAYQSALAYARERVQSAPIGGGAPVRIIEHPDVRRMLLTIRATTQGIRAMAYYNASAIDATRSASTPETRQAAQGLADLLTPITKAYATDIGVEAAGSALQVFGGAGYIEETGAAQHWRDSRIAPIYEGTNGIQALDLVNRKLFADGGSAWRDLLKEMRRFSVGNVTSTRLSPTRLSEAVEQLAEASEHILGVSAADRAAVATSYLRLFGTVLAAYLLAQQAKLAAERQSAGADDEFLSAKIITARFFADEILPQAGALYRMVMEGSAEALTILSDAQFGL